MIIYLIWMREKCRFIWNKLFALSALIRLLMLRGPRVFVYQLKCYNVFCSSVPCLVLCFFLFLCQSTAFPETCGASLIFLLLCVNDNSSIHYQWLVLVFLFHHYSLIQVWVITSVNIFQLPWTSLMYFVFLLPYLAYTFWFACSCTVVRFCAVVYGMQTDSVLFVSIQ
jgi:hypothetical protein